MSMEGQWKVSVAGEDPGDADSLGVGRGRDAHCRAMEEASSLANEGPP